MTDIKIIENNSIGHRQRLRQKLMDSKKGKIPDYEILELFLFNAIPRKDVKTLAKKLLKKFGNLQKVIYASPEQLASVDGLGNIAAANFRLMQEISERMLKEDFTRHTVIQGWKSLLDYCRISMGYQNTEQFRILYLNKKLILISDELQESGTIDETAIYIREIARRSLEVGASNIILVHNHPSGDSNPSIQDIEITKNLIQALKPLNVEVIDHIIVSYNSYYSFKNFGLI